MKSTFKKTNLIRMISGISVVIIFFVVSMFQIPVSSAEEVNPVANEPAQYTLLEPLPCINGNGVTCTPGTLLKKVNFKDYVQYMFNLIIAISAVLAVFMIVWGGFKYTSTDSFMDKNEGKKIIWQALQGLLLVLCAFLILRTIDPRLVEIPSTLVKPLDIKIQKGLSGAFFEQLAAEATRIEDERLVNASNARALQNKRDSLSAQIASATDPTEIRKLTDQKTQADIDYIKTQMITDVNAQILNSLYTDQAAVPNDVLKQTNLSIDRINQLRDMRTGEALSKGYNADITGINPVANYGEAYLALTKADIMINSYSSNVDEYGNVQTSMLQPNGAGSKGYGSSPSGAQREIQNILNTVNISSVNDPKLSAALQIKLDATKAKLATTIK